MTNAPFLSLAELFGSRDQFWDLSQTIVPVREIGSDALANGQLVGSDATSALTAAGTAGTVAVTSLHDAYLTGIFLKEPNVATKNSTFIRDITWLRNLGGTLTQISYLNLVPYIGDSIGNGGGDQRSYRIEGIPFGTLIRAGDVFSANYFNSAATAFVAGAVIGYRGFQGPPA